MSAEIDDLKAQLAVLMQERKERNDSVVDPIQNGVNALRGSLKTLVGMHPNHDLSDLVKRVDDWEDKLDSKKTGSFLFALEKYLGKNGPVVHDFAYTRELAENTHQAALDKEAEPTTVTPAPVDEDSQHGQSDDAVKNED